MVRENRSTSHIRRMATQCCVEGCMKMSAYNSTTLKRDLPLKPNLLNKPSRMFGLCLDHFVRESLYPPPPAPSGSSEPRTRAFDDSKGVDEDGSTYEYSRLGGWDDSNAKVGQLCISFVSFCLIISFALAFQEKIILAITPSPIHVLVHVLHLSLPHSMQR